MAECERLTLTASARLIVLVGSMFLGCTSSDSVDSGVGGSGNAAGTRGMDAGVAGLFPIRYAGLGTVFDGPTRVGQVIMLADREDLCEVLGPAPPDELSALNIVMFDTSVGTYALQEQPVAGSRQLTATWISVHGGAPAPKRHGSEGQLSLSMLQPTGAAVMDATATAAGEFSLRFPTHPSQTVVCTWSTDRPDASMETATCDCRREDGSTFTCSPGGLRTCCNDGAPGDTVVGTFTATRCPALDVTF